MNKYRPVMWLVTRVASFFFVLIFGKGYGGKGVMEGVRFGLHIGIFSGFSMGFGSYSTMPITLGIAFGWFLITIVESIVLPDRALPEAGPFVCFGPSGSFPAGGAESAS